MIFAIIIFVFSFLSWIVLTNIFKSKIRHGQGTMIGLFFYHYFMHEVYYIAFNGGVDAKTYHRVARTMEPWQWMEKFNFGTDFMEWFIFPWFQLFPLESSFKGAMLLFSFFGLIGIFFFYLSLVENIKFKHKLFNVDLVLIFTFLPNIHVWSSSLGKGSYMIMSLGLFFYGISRLKKRKLYIILGGFLAFMVRPHFGVFILLGAAFVALTGSKMKTYMRVFLLICGSVLTYFTIDFVAAKLGFQAVDYESLSNQFNAQAERLARADSGVDITNYNQAMKLFTFLYRPLFIDSPNALGILVSLENLFYLFLSIKVLFSKSFLGFIRNGRWFPRLAFFTFLISSIAMAQIMSNMGIAIRQKAQYFMLFGIFLLAYADYYYLKTGKPLLK